MFTRTIVLLHLLTFILVQHTPLVHAINPRHIPSLKLPAQFRNYAATSHPALTLAMQQCAYTDKTCICNSKDIWTALDSCDVCTSTLSMPASLPTPYVTQLSAGFCAPAQTDMLDDYRRTFVPTSIDGASSIRSPPNRAPYMRPIRRDAMTTSTTRVRSTIYETVVATRTVQPTPSSSPGIVATPAAPSNGALAYPSYTPAYATPTATPSSDVALNTSGGTSQGSDSDSGGAPIFASRITPVASGVAMSTGAYVPFSIVTINWSGVPGNSLAYSMGKPTPTATAGVKNGARKVVANGVVLGGLVGMGFLV